MNMPQGTEINNSPASSAELPYTEVVVTLKYKRPRTDLPTPIETRNRYTPLGDPRLQITRCYDGESTPRTARRPPPIVMGTQMPVQQLKNLMLANGIRGFNIKKHNYVRRSVPGHQRRTPNGHKRLRPQKRKDS